MKFRAFVYIDRIFLDFSMYVLPLTGLLQITQMVFGYNFTNDFKSHTYTHSGNSLFSDAINSYPAQLNSQFPYDFALTIVCIICERALGWSLKFKKREKPLDKSTPCDLTTNPELHYYPTKD